jgi:hypothetical protein
MPVERTATSLSSAELGITPREGLVSVEKAKFNLMPEALSDISWTEADELNQIYRECHNIIFKQSPASKYFADIEESKAFITKVKNEKCSLKSFILTVMWAHQLANPSKPFYKNMLLGDAAFRRVSRYRKEVENIYGTFTEATLSDFSTENMIESESAFQLVSGESLAGHWILGHKMRHSGSAVDPFFASCEFELPALWLALEPLYYPVLKTRSNETPALSKHRIQVTRLVVELKKDKKRAIALFKLKESLMPRVIQKVLGEIGFNSGHFKTSESFDSTPVFWSRLALALQQYWCWQVISGNKAAIKHLSSGTLNSL